MKTILIIGASGFIGNRLFKSLKECSSFNVIGSYYKNCRSDDLIFLDITDQDQIESILSRYRPDTVLWPAGSKNIKDCEKDIEFAKSINTYPIRDYLKISQKLKLREHFVFFSTDYVFDGQRGDFSENSSPKPKTNYGLSNFLAEQMIVSDHENYSIMRTSAVMGKGGAFFDWLIAEMIKGEKVELFSNIYFSPTPISFLIKNIASVIKRRELGILHICGDKKLSRFEFANYIKNINKKFTSHLIPVEWDFDESCFQRDLSMTPSDFCTPFLKNGTLDYLREELSND